MFTQTPTDIYVVKKVDHSFISECDGLIKIGQGKQVLELIQAIPVKAIPRKYLSQIGTLLNRTGGSYYCLKILHSYIRGSYYDLGTDIEKKVYAKALIEIGAQNEGLDLINELNTSDDPSILLTKSFCYFKSWDYQTALPLMLKYINQVDDEYMKLVGKINLSSIYIFLQKYDLALSTLTHLEEALSQKQQLLKGYVLEQMGQIYLQQGHYEKATHTLTNSINILKNSNQKALLYPQKWLGLLNLKTKNNSKLLNDVRNKNFLFNDFETLRDLDYWQGTINDDHDLLSKVYYGTPFTSFQNRIDKKNVYASWSWGKSSNASIFNVFGDKLPMTNELTSQLFCHLVSDNYKPMTLGSIHAALFGDEFYNPESSPDRIYQIISRLNKKLNSQFNYKIEKTNGLYQISPENINNFLYSVNKNDVELISNPKDILASQVKTFFRDANFTAKELSSKFNITQRTANRWIAELSDKNSVVKIGQGRSTKYKVAC